MYSEKELAAMQAIYPQNLIFTQEHIKNGGSILFLFGKLTLKNLTKTEGICYCFFGIQLAT